MELVDLALPGLQGDQYQHQPFNFIHEKSRNFHWYVHYQQPTFNGAIKDEYSLLP